MKNNGQALVLFIILIPVFLLLTAIFIDIGINSYNEKNFYGVSEDVVKTLLDNEVLKHINYKNEEVTLKLKEQAVMLYDANDINTDNLIVSINNNEEIILFNTFNHYSFLNSLFGRENGIREIEIEIKGYIKNDEKIIEFKGGTYENK